MFPETGLSWLDDDSILQLCLDMKMYEVSALMAELFNRLEVALIEIEELKEALAERGVYIDDGRRKSQAANKGLV